jgi:hypothetical protein
MVYSQGMILIDVLVLHFNSIMVVRNDPFPAYTITPKDLQKQGGSYERERGNIIIQVLPAVEP